MVLWSMGLSGVCVLGSIATFYLCVCPSLCLDRVSVLRTKSLGVSEDSVCTCVCMSACVCMV